MLASSSGNQTDPVAEDMDDVTTSGQPPPQPPAGPARTILPQKKGRQAPEEFDMTIGDENNPRPPPQPPQPISQPIHVTNNTTHLHIDPQVVHAITAHQVIRETNKTNATATVI